MGNLIGLLIAMTLAICVGAVNINDIMRYVRGDFDAKLIGWAIMLTIASILTLIMVLTLLAIGQVRMMP